MRNRLVGMPASVLLMVLLLFTTLAAQSVSTAQINGTIRDESGGGLPGVTITVTQAETGLTRTAVTGRSVGLPLFESLEVLGRDRTLARLRDAAAKL